MEGFSFLLIVYRNRMNRTVLGRSLATAGVIAGILIEHDRLADLFIKEKDGRADFDASAATDAYFLINKNTHCAISSSTVAASSGNMISWWPVRAKFRPLTAVGRRRTFSRGR